MQGERKMRRPPHNWHTHTHFCSGIKVYRRHTRVRTCTLSCFQHVHASDSACACKGREHAILLVRQNSDYRGEIRSLRPADPVFYLWKTGGCMSQQDGKVCLDGQRVQRWEGPRRNEASLAESAVSEFKWCKWGVGRVKQDGEIPLIRAHVHKRAQALATLTPAGQLGTLGGFCLDGYHVTKVTWYQSHHKKGFFN